MRTEQISPRYIDGQELEFEDAVYVRCDLLTGNRRGPTWARYVVGGSQTIPAQGREIWYRWSQEQWKSVRLGV